MAKAKSDNKYHSEVVMRTALTDLQYDKGQAQSDAYLILNDVIEELLEKRAVVENVRNFVVTMNAEIARR